VPLYNVQSYLDKTPPAIARGWMGDYSLTEDDLRVALELFCEQEPRRVLEFGVNQGHTAAFLLHHCAFIESYIGVDLEPDLFPTRGIVPQIAGDLALGDPRYSTVLTDETIPTLRRILKQRGDQEFDCIIIDANHSEPGTRRDTEGCDPLLRTGGLWIWHDDNVGSRQDPNVKRFGVKDYLDKLEAAGRTIWRPDQTDRNPWACVSLAFEIKGVEL
jgi:predicted O-methyltransferase YrrM